MNGDSDVKGVGQRVRALAVALLLSVFGVPVLMWLQAGEAGAQLDPIQKVATSRFDLPPDPAPSSQLPAPGSGTGEAVPGARWQVPGNDIGEPSGAAAALVRPDAGGHRRGTPGTQRSWPPPRSAGYPARAAGVGGGHSGPATGTSQPGARLEYPIPARAAAPPDPFVPEPPPSGWPKPAPKPAVAAPVSVAAAPAAAKPSVPTKTAPVRAIVPVVRETPRSEAQRPAPAPVAQPSAEPAPEPPPTPLEEVRLRGIIRGAPDLALMLVDGQTYFLKAGDTVTGTWVVADIKDNSVVLRSGDHVRELQIEGGSQT